MSLYGQFNAASLGFLALCLSAAIPAIAQNDSHLHVTAADIEARNRSIAAGDKERRSIGTPATTPVPSPTPSADSRGGVKKGTPTGPGSALPSSSSSSGKTNTGGEK